MDNISDIHKISARKFIDYCKDKFGWKDLSKDVVMDVGCGEHGHCGKAILESFPTMKAIIGIDVDPKVIRSFRLRNTTKMECSLANIENRESLQQYVGKMDKVVSTHVIHQLIEKEEAFRSLFYLLKPGGEAAVLFVMKSLLYEWLTEMLKNPKWKEGYQGHFVEDLYKSEFGSAHYKEMVEKIGFQVVECSEEKRVIPYPSDEVCKNAFYLMSGRNFKVPPELLEEFKEDSLRVLLKFSPRDPRGRPCYRSIELSLLLVKPPEGSSAEAKQNIGS